MDIFLLNSINSVEIKDFIRCYFILDYDKSNVVFFNHKLVWCWVKPQQNPTDKNALVNLLDWNQNIIAFFGITQIQYRYYQLVC